MKTIKIKNVIYILENFCDISLDIKEQCISFYIDYQNNYVKVDFESKTECLEKWNQIQNKLGVN